MSLKCGINDWYSFDCTCAKCQAQTEIDCLYAALATGNGALYKLDRFLSSNVLYKTWLTRDILYLFPVKCAKLGPSSSTVKTSTYPRRSDFDKPCFVKEIKYMFACDDESYASRCWFFWLESRHTFSGWHCMVLYYVWVIPISLCVASISCKL